MKRTENERLDESTLATIQKRYGEGSIMRLGQADHGRGHEVGPRGDRGPVEYRSPGEKPRAIAGADGVNVYVPGPSQGRKLLKRSDPSKRAPEVYHLRTRQVYFLAGWVEPSSMAALAGPGEFDSSRPFDPSFEKPVEAAKEDKFCREFYYSAEEWRQIELDWPGMAELLALSLR